VSEFAGMVKTSVGVVPLVVLNAVDNVATLGGLLTTVGMTSSDAERCERVIDESEFGHIITICVLAICFPKPNAIQPRVEEPVLCKAYSTLEPLTVADMHMRATHRESPVKVVVLLSARS